MTGLEPVDLPADAIEVGRVTDAWGIKGWFKVLTHSADPEALFSSKRWYLQASERCAKTFSGTRLMRVRETKEHSGTLVASAHDVDDRSAAEALRGVRIFVPRSSFPTAAIDEYYWVDLIGLSVVNRQGDVFGTVKELASTGPQSVLVIESLVDGKVIERMIPFVSAYVDQVDLPGRRILVDWLPDYWD